MSFKSKANGTSVDMTKATVPSVAPSFDMAAIIAQAVNQAVTAATGPMAAELAKLKAENDKLKTAKPAVQPLSMRVSDKRALSVYGLGRFPVTLYKSQWKRLLAFAKSIEAFIVQHDAELAEKGDN